MRLERAYLGLFVGAGEGSHWRRLAVEHRFWRRLAVELAKARAGEGSHWRRLALAKARTGEGSQWSWRRLALAKARSGEGSQWSCDSLMPFSDGNPGVETRGHDGGPRSTAGMGSE